MKQATAQLPPGTELVDVMGVGYGANPDVVAVCLLAGIVLLYLVLFVGLGFAIPIPVLVVLALLARSLAMPARVLMFTRDGFLLMGLNIWTGPDKLLGQISHLAPDSGRRAYWRRPLVADSNVLWLTPRQMRRLPAAVVRSANED